MAQCSPINPDELTVSLCDTLSGVSWTNNRTQLRFKPYYSLNVSILCALLVSPETFLYHFYSELYMMRTSHGNHA